MNCFCVVVSALLLTVAAIFQNDPRFVITAKFDEGCDVLHLKSASGTKIISSSFPGYLTSVLYQTTAMLR